MVIGTGDNRSPDTLADDVSSQPQEMSRSFQGELMRAGISARCFALCSVCGLLLFGTWSRAGEVTLADGTVIKGKQPVFLDTVGVRALRPDPDKSPNLAVIMVEESSAVRLFVPKLRAKDVNMEINLRPSERFKLPTEKRGRNRKIEQVAGEVQQTAWDEHGHRRVTFNVAGKKVDVMQEIVELTPKYFKVTAMDYLWEFGLPTNSIPAEVLDKMLHRATKPDDPDDRFAIARFYLEGEFYPLAQHELESISADFPDRAKQVDELTLQLKQFLANQALNLLEERREVGQFKFAEDTARRFLSLDIPDISPATLQTLRQAVARADEERTRLDDVRQLLGELQAQLPAEQAAEVAPLRAVIAEGLHPDTLDRLAPFIDLAEAQGRKSDEKIALALSGWILGADQADTDLKNAIRLWQARGLLIEYLRAEHPAERAAIVEQLLKVEGVGPRQVARLLPLLPPRLDTPQMAAGTPFSVSVSKRTTADPDIQYEVLLPPEYHAGRSYPTVVVLHAAGMTPQAELRWWARQGQRQGYILLAPVFAEANQRKYDYSLEAHCAVQETIRDARRRFAVDSDRIFLGGHGLGADAVFDIGYSHPDLFAGIIPITGICEDFSHASRENAKKLPQFILGGELDRDTLERNTADLDQMMRGGYPVIYAIFIGRGHEDFQSEDARLFDWMSRQRRAKPPLEIDVRTARTTDNRFWWWTFSNFPPKFGVTSWPKDQKTLPKPIVLSASAKRAKGDNVINIQCGARFHALWLFPDVVSFEKTLIIRHNGVQQYHEIPEPDISAMLEDFRLRADRQQIAWAYLEFGSMATGRATSEATNRAQRISSRPR